MISPLSVVRNRLVFTAKEAVLLPQQGQPLGWRKHWHHNSHFLSVSLENHRNGINVGLQLLNSDGLRETCCLSSYRKPCSKHTSAVAVHDYYADLGIAAAISDSYLPSQAVLGNVQDEIKEATLPIIHYGLDLWTCKVSWRTYLSVHVSYVDSNFTLRHALLAVSTFPRCPPRLPL